MTDRLTRIRDLLWAGHTPERVADELGIQPRSVARWLHRHGEHVLARRFELADRANACVTCGSPCSHNARWCVQCVRGLSNEQKRKADVA